MRHRLLGKVLLLSDGVCLSENDPVAVITLKGDDSAPALLLCLTALGVNDLNKQHRWANAGVLGAFQRKLIPQLTHTTFAFTFIIIQMPI